MVEFAPRLHFIFVSLVFTPGELEGWAWGVASASVMLTTFTILLFQSR